MNWINILNISNKECTTIIKNKIVLILICLLLIVNYSYSQLPSYGDFGFFNTYKEIKFYWGISFETFGKIKSIDQTKYKLVKKSGVLTKGKKIGDFDNDSNYYIKFDEHGRVIETIDFPTRSNYRTYTYNYDEFENLIEVMGLNAKGNKVNVEKYAYDELGKLIEEEFIDLNTYKKYTHNYVENGTIIETFYTELHGYPLISFLIDVFVIEESNREEDVYLKFVKSYNENGNLVKEITYKSNINENIGNVIETYTCEYDINGKVLNELKTMDRICEAKSTIQLNHYYNENGLKTGTNLIFDYGGLKWYINTKIIRDVDDTIIEIIENQNTSLNKNLIKYSEKFEYDGYKNISKIFFFKNDKPKYLIERQLEYY